MENVDCVDMAPSGTVSELPVSEAENHLFNQKSRKRVENRINILYNYKSYFVVFFQSHVVGEGTLEAQG